MATLREAYIDESPEILSLYGKPVASLFSSPPEAFSWDSKLVEAIREFNADLGHTPPFTGNEAVVITGQQPGIFAGPLYSVYKAITTIKLAENISQKHDVPCVPIFWVGSEDHDFDEAATIWYPSKKHVSHSLTLEQQPDQAGNALHQVSLTEQIHELIDELGDSVVTAEFADEILTFLHDSARASESLSDWSTRCMVRLFRDTPLVFFAPHLLAARRVSSAVIGSAIRDPLGATQCVNEGAAALERLGYAAQVVKNDHECAFFIETKTRRFKVTYGSDGFHLPESDETVTEEELLARLDKSPEQFSPNVALRCVVQQTLFPVAAYVAGPGELAYWGQFKGVFDLFEKPMPVVYPRAEAVLTTIKTNKLLSKYGLSVAELCDGKDALVEKALRTVAQSPALAHTREQRALLQENLSQLVSGLERDVPVAATMAVTLTADLERKLDRLESVILQSDKQQHETVSKHIDRLSECLAPRRKPQERMYTIFAFLFEHGWGLMDTLLREIEIDSFDMNEVEL